MTMTITIRNVINKQHISIHTSTYLGTSRKYLDLGSLSRAPEQNYFVKVMLMTSAIQIAWLTEKML
jgi:hypothetical protein